MSFLYDLAADTSASTGTGSIVLADSPPVGIYLNAVRSIHSVVADGQRITVRVDGTDSGGKASVVFSGVYVASTKTIPRTTVHANVGAANPVNFTSITSVELVSHAGAMEAVTLPVINATITGSNYTLTPNRHHRLTVSGLTGDRNLILPDSGNVGDVCSWELVTDTTTTGLYATSYSLILATAAAGSTFQGTDISAGSGFMRYNSEGEGGKASCTAAGGAGAYAWNMRAHWDGRIPSYCAYNGNQSLSDNVLTFADLSVLTQNAGNNGFIYDTTDDRIYGRRGSFLLVAGALHMGAFSLGAGDYCLMRPDGSVTYTGWGDYMLDSYGSAQDRELSLSGTFGCTLSNGQFVRLEMRNNCSQTESAEVGLSVLEILRYH